MPRYSALVVGDLNQLKLFRFESYKIGGCWGDYFVLKPGRMGTGKHGERAHSNRDKPFSPRYFDQVYRCDIDYEATKRKGTEDALEEWNDTSGRYCIDEDDTVEEYVSRNSSIATSLVIAGGKLYDFEGPYWWTDKTTQTEGRKWEEEFDKLILSLPDDTMLTIVDVNI